MRKVITDKDEYIVYTFGFKRGSIVFTPVDLTPDEAIRIFKETNSLKFYNNDTLVQQHDKVVFVGATYDSNHEILEITMRTPNETEKKVDNLTESNMNVEDAICELYEMITALKEGK